jgi:Fe-S-cluster containining protein
VIDAGDFETWLDDVRAAIRGERDAVVPCGECTACCTSAQFVHVEPDETDTLAHLPRELLFPAPGLPPGHLLMGYDERGHCPMFVDGRCSVYEHRPRTCRTYDCRVFAAADVEPDKPAIAARVAEWRFSYPTPADSTAHAQVRAAGAETAAAINATERAIRAVMSGPDRPAI